MSDNDILYPGPSDEYKPSLGKHVHSNTFGRTVTLDYANKDHLTDLLDHIKSQANKIIEDTETELEKYSLKVDDGSKLQDAHATEWPAELGEPKNHVSYLEYKALGAKQSRSASYIRKTYEDNLRGPSGTNAVDVLNMATALHNEATNIEEFLNASVGDIDDDSEKRALELLQDWAENAVFHTGRIRSLYEKREPQATLSAPELDLLSGKQAEQYQALFKIKLNAINNQVATLQEEIKKDHSDLSQIYFKKFLGPAIKFRLGAMKDIGGAAHSPVGKLRGEASSGAATANSNLSVIIADQLRRNNSFEDKFALLEKRIKERDQYIGYIKQLEDRGRKVKAMFTEVILDEGEMVLFGDQIEAGKTVSHNFESSHADLSGVDDDDAHTQYLLRSGGTITGDIELDDATIDGIVPSTHEHDGADGSVKIHGRNIVGGTITSDNVNTDDVPEQPNDLSVVTLTPRTNPPGGTVVDALVAWEGPENCTFEFQIVRVL